MHVYSPTTHLMLQHLQNMKRHDQNVEWTENGFAND